MANYNNDNDDGDDEAKRQSREEKKDVAWKRKMNGMMDVVSPTNVRPDPSAPQSSRGLAASGLAGGAFLPIYYYRVCWAGRQSSGPDRGSRAARLITLFANETRIIIFNAPRHRTHYIHSHDHQARAPRAAGRQKGEKEKEKE